MSDKKYEQSLHNVTEVCSQPEFTFRELFRAFDVNGDGVITKEDLKLLAKADGEKKYFSKKDLRAIYARIGKKLCQGLYEKMEKESGDECISIDELLNVLDKNGDGKVKMGEFMRIARKDGNLMNITQEELEEEFEGLWQNPEEKKGFFEKLFN